MQESIRNQITQLSEKWKALDKSLRIKIILLITFLLIALGLTIFLAVRPKWVVIEANSDANTIGQIENIFTDASIKSRIVKNASAIEVQQKDVDQAKILLAQSNVTNVGFTFADAFNTSSIGMSESDKQKMYLSASQTELARHIESIDGIESANVKLVVPGDTVLFEKEKQEASASITLVTSKDISREQALTIARLVCMSVENLDMKNIEIVDQNADSLYSGSSNDSSSYSSKEDIEKQKQKEVEMKIRAALVQLYDDVNIITNLRIDWSRRQQKNVTYTPPIDDMTVGVPSRLSRQEESVVNGAEGEEPGVAANDQMPANYATGDETGATYDSSKEDTEYNYNTSEEVVDTDGGELLLDQSSASVVVYRLRNYDEKILRENGTLNEQNTWEDFKTANSQEVRLEIDPDLVETLRTGTGITNLSVVGYEKPVFIDEEVKPLAIEQIIILAILAVLLVLLAFALIRKTQPDEVEEIEPELSVEDLIVSSQLDNEEEEDQELLAGINEVESEYMKQISKFVEEKPEAVAQLLRNWLSDEWE